MIASARWFVGKGHTTSKNNPFTLVMATPFSGWPFPASDQVTHCHIFGGWFIFLACVPYLHFAQPAIVRREQAAAVADAGAVGN